MEFLDINPAGDSFPSLLLVYQDHLYFTADDGLNNTELWRTDGTVTGTELFIDLNLGASHTRIREMVVCNGVACFLAGRTEPWGYMGVWRTDGTVAGTYSLKDIGQGQEFVTWPTPGVIVNDRLYFGLDGQYSELWSTDGTVSGTRVEWTAPTGASAGQGLLPSGGVLYFTLGWKGAFGRATELWSLESEEASFVFDFDPVGDSVSIWFLGAVGSNVMLGVHNDKYEPAWDYSCWVLRATADFSSSHGNDDDAGCSGTAIQRPWAPIAAVVLVVAWRGFGRLHRLRRMRARSMQRTMPTSRAF
jgi:ELWxxDGT repeat protein